MKPISRSIVRFVLTSLPLIGGLNVNADDEPPPTRTVSVSGRGRISAQPNVAEVSAGVLTRATTASAALSSNSQRMTALQNLLKERGVAAKDVQTSQLSLMPIPGQPAPPEPGRPLPDSTPQIAGYQVQNMVRVTVRDLAQLGPLLDAIVGAGANNVYGVSLRTDSGALVREARKRAMADAREKAELLAGEGGLVLGPPITIREDSYAPAPPPPPAGPYVMAAPAMGVPVSVGEQETAVTVYVVFGLKLPR
jgi:uncharacterized protein YggE